VYSEGKLMNEYQGSSTLEKQLSATIVIDSLKSNTKYSYEVLINNTKVNFPVIKEFKTYSKDFNSNTRIIFGSCYHRIGLGNEKLSKTIIDRDADAALLLGDIAVQDRDNHLGKHTLDYLMRDLFPAWRQMASCVPLYAIWDDHDYYNNDSYGLYGYNEQDRLNIREVFKYAWNNPSYGNGEHGVYFKKSLPGVDVFMLDGRYFREKGNLLGDEQYKWLLSELKASMAPFKILANGTMWSDFLSDGKDSWGVFDSIGRENLFSFIEENKISGVLLISGDRHGARGFTIPRANNFKFYEFGAASLGSMSGPPVSKPEWSTNFYGFAGIYAFGEFTFHFMNDNPFVTFRLIQDSGNVLVEKEITFYELNPR